MTVTTVFADTNDGWVQSADVDYADARAGTGAKGLHSDLVLRVGQWLSGQYVVDQAFCKFDTSTIPVTDLVSSAVLEMFWVTDQTTADFTLRVRAFDWTAPLDTGDFIAGASISATGTHVASLAAGGGVLSTYLTFTNVALPANINKGGITSLYYYSLNQENGTAPVSNQYVEFSSADEAGTTQDPKITITHAATQSRFPYSGTPFRVWPRRQ